MKPLPKLSLTEEDMIRKNLEAQLKFERLLTDITAQFIALPSHHLDSEIRNAQRQLCECLNIDLCVLWQLSADARSLILTHIHAPADFKPLPPVLDAREDFPWFLEKMLRNESIVTNRKSDLPPQAARDLQSWNYYEIQSALTFPLSAGGGSVFGSLTFCVIRQERVWEPELINRLQLVAQIFSSALARKMAEDALRESEARVSLAAEAAKAGLWMLDKNTGVFWATDRAKEIFNFRPEDEVNFEKFLALVHPEERERIRTKVEESFRSGAEYFEEYRIIPAPDRVCWVSARGRIMTNKPECLIGVVVDISERKKNEGQMQSLRRELTHVSRVVTLNELSTSLAHEINQPLTAILNNAEAAIYLLSKKKPDLKEIQSILTEIVQDDTRASHVIQHLRQFLKKQEIEFKAVDVPDLLRETVRFLQSEAVIRKINILVRCPERMGLIYGDRIQLQQVLLNLITNGLEAMAEKNSGAGNLTLEGCQTNDRIIISVTDDGPGVASDLMGRLFEPFYTTKSAGLGMGLAISKSIIESHGGELKVKNNSKGGATFYFALPIFSKG